MLLVRVDLDRRQLPLSFLTDGHAPSCLPLASHPDLLWASCGSGGGTFGIVTRFVFGITPLPNEGRLALIKVRPALAALSCLRSASPQYCAC
jgi:FAD/FMN-containing dehydrogenase